MKTCSHVSLHFGGVRVDKARADADANVPEDGIASVIENLCQAINDAVWQELGYHVRVLPKQHKTLEALLNESIQAQGITLESSASSGDPILVQPGNCCVKAFAEAAGIGRCAQCVRRTV